MNNRAKRYIKPEARTRNSKQEDTSQEIAQIEVSSDQPKNDQIQNETAEKPNNQRKNSASLENSVITESSEEDSSQPSLLRVESRKNSKDQAVAHRKSKVDRSTMPELVVNIPQRTLTRLNSNSQSPGVTRSASILSRHRLSTLDPNTLKRLKSIKADTLNNEDQIEVLIL